MAIREPVPVHESIGWVMRREASGELVARGSGAAPCRRVFPWLTLALVGSVASLISWIA